MKPTESIPSPTSSDDSETRTIKPADSDAPASTSTFFDGFTDFQLDLSCLSAPSSPVASHSELSLDEELGAIEPPRTPSPASAAVPILARSTSFASQMSPLPLLKSARRLSSPQLASEPSGKSSRGSWPLIKFAGRGTPIDRSRWLEWGGGQVHEVTEDGVIYGGGGIRSTSFDSGARPSERSLSPDWRHISPLSLTRTNSTASESFAPPLTEIEPPPALAPIEKPAIDEWDSLLNSVLGSVEEKPEQAEEQQCEDGPKSHEACIPAVKKAAPINFSLMTPEQVEQLNAGLDMELGLNASLDLGLSCHEVGKAWSDFQPLPSSGCGRDSPSMYSQAQTQRESPPPSIHRSEQRSNTVCTIEAAGVGVELSKTSRQRRWWKRVLYRLRKVRTVMTTHL